MPARATGSGPGPGPGDSVAGRYRLRRQIARGAMGVVFEAEHLYTGRIVALKLLADDVAAIVALQQRLVREAEVLGTIDHPNVVAVLDAGSDARGLPFVAMEMLEGRTLEGLLTSRGRLSVDDAVSVARALCEALRAVHTLGIVHRDVKPANVFVARTRGGGEVLKLIDFGVAALRGSAAAGSVQLTLVGGLVGTPGYMPAEQILSQPVDARADLFAAGVVLYECLAGERPFPGTLPEIAPRLIAGESAPPLSSVRDDVPAALAAVIDRALSRLPADRPASAAELARVLRSIAGDRDPSLSLLGLAPTAPLGEAPIELRRRHETRAPYVTPIRITRDQGDVDGHCEAISASGMLVVAEGAFTEGDTVTVRFALPVSGEPVRLGARVRWVRAARGHHAFGLEFIEPMVHVVDALRAYASRAGSAAG